MNISTTKIVTDSSSDILSLSDIAFSSAPLKIVTAQKEYVDDEALDVQGMVDDLATYRGKSSTSCPNPEDWVRAFGDAEHVFCVTITGTLSGSYNSAIVAKKAYEEAHPDRRVFVLNSLSTGPEMALVILKIRELILAGESFDAICDAAVEYNKKTGLLFMLESMRNLANNGRVSPLVAKMAGFLGIRLIAKASDRGDIEPLEKCRGEKKALDTLTELLISQGLSPCGKVRIAHCFNETATLALRDRLLEKFDAIQVEISPCRGLCSFYAERGGLLVGFEKA